jgi:hypothetical protein
MLAAIAKQDLEFDYSRAPPLLLKLLANPSRFSKKVTTPEMLDQILAALNSLRYFQLLAPEYYVVQMDLSRIALDYLKADRPDLYDRVMVYCRKSEWNYYVVQPAVAKTDLQTLRVVVENSKRVRQLHFTLLDILGMKPNEEVLNLVVQYFRYDREHTWDFDLNALKDMVLDHICGGHLSFARTVLSAYPRFCRKFFKVTRSKYYSEPPILTAIAKQDAKCLEVLLELRAEFVGFLTPPERAHVQSQIQQPSRGSGPDRRREMVDIVTWGALWGALRGAWISAVVRTPRFKPANT